MNAAATPGLALTATSAGVTLTNGGTYTPGSSITVSNTGGGQYGIYISAGTFNGGVPTLCAGKLVTAGATLTAPLTGPLILVGMRAPGFGVVTYQVISLTAGGGSGGGGGGGGIIGPPPPPQGAIVPPSQSPYRYVSPDGRHTVQWNPEVTGMSVTVSARANYVAFARSDTGQMLSGAGVNLAVVASANGAPVVGHLMRGKTLGDMAPVSQLSLTQCGISAIQSSNLAGELTLSFQLAFIDGATSPSCLVDGASLSSLALARDTPPVRIIVASGSSAEFEYHDNGHAVADALSADGRSLGAVAPGGTLLAAHVACMIISWMALAPAGAAVSRYMRDRPPEGWWFIWHKRCLIGAAIFTVIGFALAYTHADVHFVSTHSQLGLLMVIMSLAQPLLGVLRPAKEAPRRKTWERVHKTAGRIMLPLGVVVCLLGAYISPYGDGLFFGLLAVAIALAAVVARTCNVAGNSKSRN